MSRKAIFTPEEIKSRRTARTLARRKWRRENEPGYQDGIRAGWRRWYANGNQQVVKDHVKRYRAENPHMAVYTNRKSNAKRMGKEFTIAFEDIAFPTHCPVLGIELDYGKKRGRPEDNSPSFDRVNHLKATLKATWWSCRSSRTGSRHRPPPSRYAAWRTFTRPWSHPRVTAALA